MSEVTIRHLVPILHGTQTFLALIVMGLDAYGIQYVAYNVSIYSLVVVRSPLLASNVL